MKEKKKRKKEKEKKEEENEKFDTLTKCGWAYCMRFSGDGELPYSRVFWSGGERRVYQAILAVYTDRQTSDYLAY